MIIFAKTVKGLFCEARSKLPFYENKEPVKNKINSEKLIFAPLSGRIYKKSPP